MKEEFGGASLDDFPRVDDSLRWVRSSNQSKRDADLFVVGAGAIFQLGPGALNLMGSMRGAKIVAEAMRDVMWTYPKRGRAPTT